MRRLKLLPVARPQRVRGLRVSGRQLPEVAIQGLGLFGCVLVDLLLAGVGTALHVGGEVKQIDLVFVLVWSRYLLGVRCWAIGTHAMLHVQLSSHPAHEQSALSHRWRPWRGTCSPRWRSSTKTGAVKKWGCGGVEGWEGRSDVLGFGFGWFEV